MEHIYDVIIIGGGAAGYSAALYTARAGLDTLVIERLSAGGQMALTDIIDNYPGFDEGVDGFTLGMKMQSGAERFGAKTEYVDIISADLTGDVKELTCESGKLYTRAVIIATGALPRELCIPRERELTNRGVHYCAHCDGRFYKDKTVIVVGGGNSAVSDALYLSHLAKKVILVHRRDTLRATKIYHEPLMRAKNVEFCWNSALTEIIAENKVSGAVITDLVSGETLRKECDGIFISIGRKPASDIFASQLTLDSAGYIVADESTKTNIEGVFAAGDVRTKVLRQVITAASDGAVAAHYAEEYLSQKE